MSKRTAGLDELVVEAIIGHSIIVGAAHYLLNSWASIMQGERWPKRGTVMRYLEHGEWIS